MQVDEQFLGLARDGESGRFDFTVENHLARLDGKLYGGTAIAVSITAAERVSDRSALWMTTQFVSTVGLGTEVRVDAEILAPGRRTNQVRVTGTSPTGEVVFASLGATGHHRDGGLDGTFESPPLVLPPEDSRRWDTPFAAFAEIAPDFPLPPVPPDTGFSAVVEMRVADVTEHPDPGPGRLCIWVRRRDCGPITPAVAAYMADMVPMSVAHACGTIAGGTSLDNTIRIGTFVETDWILIDLRPHLAVGDYGHGAAHVWSRDGHLMATASQTASMMRFDPANAPWMK